MGTDVSTISLGTRLRIHTASVARRLLERFAGVQFNGMRDLYLTLGYPREIAPAEFRGAYERGDLMARIIDAYPDATWREPPAVRKKGEQEGGSLELAVQALAKRVDLWGNMARLDRLMGLGHYGVLLLGLDGGEATDKPAGKGYRLMYVTPHGETTAQIANWDSDPRSPRFGLPLLYRVTSGPAWGGVGGASTSLVVHYTRAIHVAERALEDKSIGQPRLCRIWNRCMDVDKLLGGGAEIFWQNASQLRAWVADKDAAFDPNDKAEVEQQLEELAHGLRRDVRLQGLTPHPLVADAQSANAAALIDKELDFIAGATGIPKRILIGSERGELSSEQDENNWHARVMERREQFATPYMVRPFIDRCMALGVLEKAEYDVVWPESDTLGEEKRATIAKTKAEAVAAYVGTPGTDMVIAPEEFRIWLGEEPESDYDLVDPDELRQDEPGASAGGDDDPIDGSPEAVAAFNRRMVLADNMRPRPLYVRRDVLNWREIHEWAVAQGYASTLGAAMHVTVIYSKTPVDWLKVSPDWNQKPGDLSGVLELPEGGPRVVEVFGDAETRCHVLSFKSRDLEWRHEAIKEAGAVHGRPDYQPHITITYAPGEVDPEKIEPYRGPIILGAEIFEPITEDWSGQVIETPAGL